MTSRRSFRHLVVSMYDREADTTEHQYVFTYDPDCGETSFKDSGLNDVTEIPDNWASSPESYVGALTPIHSMALDPVLSVM